MFKILNLIINIVLVYSFISAGSLASAEPDKTVENLDISGFLRIRHWNLTGKSEVGDKFAFSDSYKNAYYEDFFFRNRFYLKVIPEIEVRAVFDIGAKLGKESDNFSLGSGDTNLVTRDVYALITLSENSQIKAGLLPFSLTGGYILARDASGLEYRRSFMNKRVEFFGALIRAYDDADSGFGDNSEPPVYSDDNIYYGGFNFNITPDIQSEIYYVYEYDKYVTETGTDGDNRKSSLHWIGSHNNFSSGNLFIKIGGIYNRGKLNLRDASNRFNKTGINAALIELECGYKFGSFQLSVFGEGATGDLNNKDAKTSFQDIKASRGYSFIVVDNMGGFAVRGGGESPWYGLYSGGLAIKYILFDAVTAELKVFHFRTTGKQKWGGASTTHFGDECNLRAEYIYKEALSIFLNAGLFLPGRAYSAYVHYSVNGLIAEANLGIKISY